MARTWGRARRRGPARRLPALVALALITSAACSNLLDTVPDSAGPTTTTSLPLGGGTSPTPGQGGPTTGPTATSVPPAPTTSTTSTTAAPPTSAPPANGTAPRAEVMPGSARGSDGAPFGRSDAVAVRYGVGVAPNGAPLLADSPELLAAQLDMAERALHDPSSPRERLDLMAHLQQLVYRRMALRPGWEDAFFGALPAAWHDVARRHLVARRHFVDPEVESVDDLPAWRIVRPAPADALLAAYQEAEAAFGVPWPTLAAMNLVESAMGRIQGPSSEGAVGPMQFDAATWAAYGRGGDVYDPRDAVLGAANFLAAHGYATDPGGALFRLRGEWQYAAGVLAYADLIRLDGAQFGALWRWEVYYHNNVADVWLPVGYDRSSRVDTLAYLAEHPPANP